MFLTYCEENAKKWREQEFPHLDGKNIYIYSAVLNPARLGLTPNMLSEAQTRRVCECPFYPR